MAKRPAFFISKGNVECRDYDFKWSGGFAVSQKQKNIAKLHAAIGDKALEVSTKSQDELGQKLSAFNLRLNGLTLENVFQSAKVFENGGPYTDLRYVSPRVAKHDARLQNSGKLKAFYYEGTLWALEPKTAFYDYIYYHAVRQSIPAEELQELLNYNYFTDIEFNPTRSINTQARAIALVKVVMRRYGHLPDCYPVEFIAFHRKCVKY